MKKYLGIFLIILIWLVILATNFSPNSWLTGWDNLHPEFNLGLNISRSFWSVWQEYQGLGLLGGMGHAADLPRQLLMLFLTRQEFFFLMLLVGPIGVYFLTKRNPAAGLFYLLNLATIQTFYAPFEPFIVQFGLLPWLIHFALEKRWKLFILSSIFAIPQGYVPTVFVVYFLTLLVIRKFKIIALTLIINAFWLLPFVYFTFNNVRVPVEAKINQMSTQSAFLQNKEFGGIKDVITLRGFWFENKDSSGYLMESWRAHFQNPVVWISGFILFGIVLFGIYKSFREKHPYRWIFLTLFLISFTIIANNTPPFSWVDNLLYKLPLVSQVFRFPFTKFSILLALMFSIYFGLAKPKLALIIPILVLYLFPVFQGNLFAKFEKLNIPQEYFQTFDFFKKQDVNTRIANFPQYTYWGWNFYDWGYQGSGFLWYGIQQPILDRAFDVWSRENENYYWEISQAVYSKNLPLFESVLNKYRVNWLLVDGNIINPSSPKALYTNELEKMISASENISLKNIFGKIKVYSFDLRVPVKSFISIAQNLPNVGPSYKWSNLDQGYFDVGDYKEGKDNLYFYRTLFTGRTQEDLEFDPDSFQRGGLVKVNDYSTLSHRDSYLIKVKTKGTGRNLFWVEDLNSRRAVLETYLTKNIGYFIIPPTEPDGLGYAFHLDNQESLEVYKIDFFKLITLRNLSNLSSTSYLNNFTVYHPNPSFYKINLNSSGTLILSQSYDSGWVAFGATNHQLINNWANGWEVKEDTTTVYLFYWPQLLEFAGFAILTIFIIGWIIKIRFTSRTNPLNSVQT